MPLPEVGMKLVVNNAPAAINNINSYNKAALTLQKTITTVGKSTGKGLPGMGGIATQLRNSSSLFQKIIPNIGKFGGSISGAKTALAALSPQTYLTVGALGALTTAIAAAAAGWAAFLKLGQRGAQVQATLTAFGGSTGGIVDSTAALQGLRKATSGTLSDMELMQSANIAMVGTTSNFRAELLKTGDDGQSALGRVIDSTNRMAVATGQNADVIREKFLRGLKLSRTLLVDDVAGKVDAVKANEAYAKSIGKAAAALTDEEKQIAFAQQAIKQLDENVARLGDKNQVLLNLRMPFVFLQNTLDKLALAIQPIFAVFAQFVADITSVATAISNFVLPIFAALAYYGGTVLRNAYNVAKAAVMAFAATFRGVAEQTAPYVIAIFQLVAKAATGMSNTIVSVANAISNVVNSIFAKFGTSIGKLMVDLILLMAKGGGMVTGAFATGLLTGGKYVVQAVTKIAQIVADFLQGFSPPKRGPLKDIDKGGENVALAWVDGFTDGFVQPLDAAVAEVDKRLGEIGTFTATQVAQRVGDLDKAVQPFVDLLDIAKADMEAIAGFTDPALEAIERQQAQLLRAGQFEAARALDMQAQKLMDLQQLRQTEVDQAQIALSIVKARQAQERSLLAIQKRRTAGEKSAGGGKSVTDAAGKAAKETAKTGGGAAVTPETAAAGLQLGEAPDLFSSEAIEKAKAALKGAFGEGLEASGFDEAMSGFAGATGELGVQLGRIQSADPVGKLQSKFAGLAGAVAGPLGQLQQTVSTTFSSISNLVTGIDFSPITTQISSIQTALNNVNPAFLSAKFATLKNNIQGQLMQLVNPGFILGEGGLFYNTFAEGSPLRLAISGFTSFLVGGFNLATTLINLGLTTFRDAFLTPFFMGIETFFTTFATEGIINALAGLPASLQTGLVDPFVQALNDVIDNVDKLIPNQVSLSFSVDIPAATGAAAALNGIPPFSEFLGTSFSIGTTIDLPDNPFRDVVGRARGGMGVRGMMLVGEQGPELIQASRPVDVFPNGLTEILAAALPILVSAGGGGGGGTVNNSRNISQQTTINVSSPEQASLIQRQQLAYGRR